MGSADDRRFEVLRAIVADFVATKEPIGSKSLVERHNLGVSSATVRNDMAVLEAEGYIAQPHTSSGRVPTEKGYREFVDRLDDIKPLSSSERTRDPVLPGVRRRPRRRAAPRGATAGPADPPGRDRPVPDAVHVDGAAPRGGGADPGPAAAGRDHRLAAASTSASSSSATPSTSISWPSCASRLGQALEGKPLSAASVAVSDLAVHLNGSGGLGDAVGRAATVLVETLVEHTEERLLLGGTANLTRNTADFGGSLRSVLEALEEQVVVLRLLAAQQEAGKVTVRIGHETEAEQMAGTSVVTTTYGSSGKVYGGMGVLGPTRMDYPGTIANVAAVALYIGEVLGSR